jgi:hypothetical protein
VAEAKHPLVTSPLARRREVSVVAPTSELTAVLGRAREEMGL